MEGNKPSLQIDFPSPYIGLTHEYTGRISDPGNGIRRIWIGLRKESKEIVLLDKTFPSKGFLSSGSLAEVPFTVQVEPKKIGLTEGKAILRIAAWDYSWRDFFHGNRTYLEKEVIIDTRPPVIDVLTRQHNISQGGTGLVIYRVSEKDVASGVVVGDNFFPGYSGHFRKENIFMAFIALGHLQGMNTEIYVKATDLAGNGRRAGFQYYLKKKVFKRDTINISDNFLNWKMPEFDLPGMQGVNVAGIDKFLAVNRDLRKANSKTFKELGEKAERSIYWDGAFQRMPASANRAGYADHRSYKYKGKVVDKQYHMGVDLAAVSHSKVPAANKGKVVFSQSNGIYGKTVVLDHGFGLFSTYSHLSKIDVGEGDIVPKGKTLGLTGTTGLAGGDHLHFGMLVHNVFVNPIEWWDGSWITNNITTKIEDAKGM